MPAVHVNLAERSYDVVVENGILDEAGDHIAELNVAKRFAVITDSNVGPHHAEAMMESLKSAGCDASLHSIPAGEASKSFSQMSELCSSLAKANHDRSSGVIALGGGVVGDLAGFVAASFFRGIPFIQVPTTIVSQVDSSVGGKTGINLPEGKNLIGAFHQPRLVLVDPGTLHTLPLREFREGFAEVIKHAAIRDADMLNDISALDPSSTSVPADLIARNIAIKARIVEEDERETAGTRALLNFGHTIGHGIEAAVPYGTLLHGEAISLGLRAALNISIKHAGLDRSEAARILDLLKKFELPLVLSDEISTEAVMTRLARDKKFMAGAIRFVMLRAPGDAYLHSGLTMDNLQEAVETIRTAS